MQHPRISFFSCTLCFMLMLTTSGLAAEEICALHGPQNGTPAAIQCYDQDLNNRATSLFQLSTTYTGIINNIHPFLHHNGTQMTFLADVNGRNKLVTADIRNKKILAEPVLTQNILMMGYAKNNKAVMIYKEHGNLKYALINLQNGSLTAIDHASNLAIDNVSSYAKGEDLKFYYITVETNGLENSFKIMSITPEGQSEVLNAGSQFALHQLTYADSAKALTFFVQPNNSTTKTLATYLTNLQYFMAIAATDNLLLGTNNHTMDSEYNFLTIEVDQTSQQVIFREYSQLGLPPKQRLVALNENFTALAIQ